MIKVSQMFEGLCRGVQRRLGTPKEGEGFVTYYHAWVVEGQVIGS